MNLLLLEAGEVDAGGGVTVSGARARHLLDVLRVDPGQTVRVGILNGPIGTAHVVACNRPGGSVMLTCVLADAPPRPAVDLLLAVPRPKVLRRLWAQIAALGVGRVLLTNAARVERNYFDTHVLDPATYEPLLVEGLQQARDTHLPEVSVHRQFKVLVEDHLDALAGGALRLVAEPGATTRVADALPTGSAPRVLLAVGPEGGWNDFELNLLGRHRFTAVDMGPRTLRSDTACIALLTLVHDALRARPSGTPSQA